MPALLPPCRPQGRCVPWPLPLLLLGPLLSPPNEYGAIGTGPKAKPLPLLPYDVAAAAGIMPALDPGSMGVPLNEPGMELEPESMPPGSAAMPLSVGSPSVPDPLAPAGAQGPGPAAPDMGAGPGVTHQGAPDQPLPGWESAAM